MKMKKFLVLILITATFICWAGCYKRVTVRQVEDTWWERGETWVKARGYKEWINVTKVEADSVYGEMRVSILDESVKSVIIPLADIERIERNKKSVELTLLGLSLAVSAVLLITYVSSLSEFN